MKYVAKFHSLLWSFTVKRHESQEAIDEAERLMKEGWEYSLERRRLKDITSSAFSGIKESFKHGYNLYSFDEAVHPTWDKILREKCTDPSKFRKKRSKKPKSSLPTLKENDE